MAKMEYSDKELRQELSWYGETPGPITATTRPVLRKKLEKLIKDTDKSSSMSSSSGRTVRRSTTQTVSYGGGSSSTRSASSASGGGTASIENEDSFDVEGETFTSPLNSTNRSRQTEKRDLSHLNDRLAQYIERVRSLEADKARLTVQIRDSEEVITRERSHLRAAYEAELSDARRLLDETAKEKARLQIDCDKARAEFDEMRAKIIKLEKEVKGQESSRMYAESQVQDMTARVNTAENAKRHLEEENKRVNKENDSLRKQLDVAKRQLEEETLLRVDNENRLQSLREELAFNKQLYEQELEETRHKRMREINEERQDLEHEFETKFQDALTRMRGDFDALIAANRREIEGKYEAKLKHMYDEAQRARDGALGSRDESKQLRITIDTMEKERNKFEGMVGGLERKIKDLEESLRGSREDFYNRLNSKESEIKVLQSEIGKMMSDYQDLMDTKIQLNVEIEAYRKLLEVEECRLHLSPTSSPTGTPTRAGARGVKRKRVLQESDADLYSTSKSKAHHDGDVEIEDHADDGSYIRLRNRGSKDLKLGGYILKREVVGESPTTYKFHNKLMIKAGESVTVYSSTSEETHSPPNVLVMKNQSWPVGESVRSSLLNQEEDEVAWRESSRTASSHTYRYTGGGTFGTSSHSATIDDPDQRCSIM